MSAVFAWLVANGLYRDLLSAAILVPIMRLMAMKPIQHLTRLIKDIEMTAYEHHDLEKVIKVAEDKKN